MGRSRVHVRDAVVGDAEALARVWSDLLLIAGVPGRTSAPPTPPAVARRLEAIEGSPTRRMLVAEDGDVLAGAVYLSREPLTPLHDDTAVRASYLHVLAEHRRRGIGRALLDAAAGWAVEVQAEHLVVDVSPHIRETNRFLARLGLRTLVSQRSVPVAVIRRRMVGGQLVGSELLGEPARRLATSGGRSRRPWHAISGR
ncbi:MAG: GNAT family N-acetyltransferase [Jiangellaceae bacterium]